ncbi:hypothetical protein CFAEC_11995 [Corynebacterium faecale]|uniref:hypothetical protein n=1 Tax=Corynebacterium faecale TaxID=1758466 RepID=UPI0025B4B27D|nr:hypothetical protein [Corynebacterium faecale]WJY93191.1 hypothetical protein CFAEC_11995 [Corynebacterium faecale]
MKARWLWVLPLVALTGVVCSTSSERDIRPDETTVVQEPEPATPAAQPGLPPASPRYERLPRDYFTVPDPGVGGQVAFSSPDGSIHCEFRPMEENPPQDGEPPGDWRVGFSQGACRWGNHHQPDYVVADSNPGNRPGFAEQQSWISHVMPDYYTPLVEGNYLDLHTMGCFTESADEISCLKYQSGEGFTITSAGYQQLSGAAVDARMETGDGVTQVFSPTPVFSFADGQEVACFHEPPDETAFFCQSYGPSLWEGSLNLVQFALSEEHVELVGARGSNPGLDVYLARQLVGAPKALVLDHLTVYNNGTRLTFLTRSGEEFWVSADAVGVGD